MKHRSKLVLFKRIFKGHYAFQPRQQCPCGCSLFIKDQRPFSGSKRKTFAIDCENCGTGKRYATLPEVLDIGLAEWKPKPPEVPYVPSMDSLQNLRRNLLVFSPGTVDRGNRLLDSLQEILLAPPEDVHNPDKHRIAHQLAELRASILDYTQTLDGENDALAALQTITTILFNGKPPATVPTAPPKFKRTPPPIHRDSQTLIVNEPGPLKLNRAQRRAIKSVVKANAPLVRRLLKKP